MTHVANLTVNAAQVQGSDKTGYRLFVDLADLNATFWNTVAIGGGDIRIFESDGTTELPRDVVSCLPGTPGTGTGELWVRLDVAGATDTVLQVHADGSSPDYAPTDPFGRNAANADPWFVLHHEGDFVDSTGNNTPTEEGAGTFDYVTTPGAVVLTGDTRYVIGTYPSGTWATGYRFSVDYDIAAGQDWPGYWRNSPGQFQMARPGSVSNSLRYRHAGSDSDITNVFQEIEGQGRVKVDVVWDTTQVLVYVDGALINSIADTTLPTDTSGLRLWLNAISTVNTNQTVWEVFMEGVARDADWIATEQNNRATATFYTVTDAGAPPVENTVTWKEFTWTYTDTGQQTGVYANGEPWIVGPVTITDIAPASTDIDGRVRNGTQINLDILNKANQGYDSSDEYGTWSAALNVSPNYTASDLVVTQGSVISSLTKVTAGERPIIDKLGILTVVATPPTANSFRPGYYGSDTTPAGTLADLDYTFLKTEAVPASAPTLAELEAWYEYPWLEQVYDFAHQGVNPFPNYGRELAHIVSESVLSLNLDYTNPQKEALFRDVVQYGLDVYEAARNGFDWPGAGGLHQGRKLALWVAGKALNDPAILAYADAAVHFIFAEDQQTFKVTQADVDQPRYTADGRVRDPYTTTMIGMNEWGEQHTRSPERDASNWGNASYRGNNFGSLMGHSVAGQLMGAQTDWNNDVFFEYHDRAYQIEKNNVGVSANGLQQFEADMWQRLPAGPAATSPPVLVNPYEGIGPEILTPNTIANVSCYSSIDEGTGYAYVSTSATPPSAAALKAGTGAAWAGSLAMTRHTMGFDIPSLPDATYYTHFIQESGGFDSNILTSDAWEVGSAPVSGSPTDARFNALRALGYSGSISDMTLAWLQDGGPATGPVTGPLKALPDAWRSVLEQLAIEDPAFNPVGDFDRSTWWYEYLQSQGYTGGRGQMDLQFWTSLSP